MKKVIMLSIIFLVLLFPFFVDAKMALEYEWKLDTNNYINSEDGIYYFYDDVGNIITYDKNGEFIGNFDMNDFGISSINDYYNNDVLATIYEKQYSSLKYNSTVDKYYYVTYSNKLVTFFGEDVTGSNIVNFLSDVDVAKEIMGKEYDVYLNLVEDNLYVSRVFIEDGYFIAESYDENDDLVYRVYNSDLELVYEKNISMDEFLVIHVYDNKIFTIEDETILNIFDLEGNLLESFDLLEDLLNLYENSTFYVNDFKIKDNNLVFQYKRFTIQNGVYSDIGFMFVKFRLMSDVEEEVPENGNFTSTRKIDENDREFIELNITPDAGYYVDRIVVTDAEGNTIEVKDNKFYTNSNDVTIQVFFKVGEYLPIPDTFLGKNISLILIGLILVSLGLYTINYIKVEE